MQEVFVIICCTIKRENHHVTIVLRVTVSLYCSHNLLISYLFTYLLTSSVSESSRRDGIQLLHFVCADRA